MKRRKRRARHAGRRDAFHLTMITVLMTVLCLMIVNIKEPEQTEEEQPETTHAEVVQNPETIVQTAKETESKYKVFDGMSEDWGSDDLEGFVFYELPEQYADKGYFPEKMQIYTRCLCKTYTTIVRSTERTERRCRRQSPRCCSKRYTEVEHDRTNSHHQRDLRGGGWQI